MTLLFTIQKSSESQGLLIPLVLALRTPCVGAMKIGSPDIKIPGQQVCMESPLQEILAF